ncbi:2Fe-2S iron-sulfur cluster-binding protein [Dactylosporangium sp. NPDC000555]|uniref:2Fe-2S iron-sulfur cluster-binding protein n=1 Tax=Dactylosporangium sp. NPDC000555 TaxID=3154260 RepID=UPI00331B77E9
MPRVVYVQPNGVELAADLPSGQNLMLGALANDVHGILGECGGQMMCGTCHVQVDPAWIAQLDKPSDEENETLEAVAFGRTPASRLSCQLLARVPLDGLRVAVAPRQV